MPKMIIEKIAYRQLVTHICATGFRHETGGVLLGYRFIKIFYIIGITFPRHSENATKTTFILNGEEHTEDVEKIIKRFIPRPQIIGIWHSHTTEDNLFSLQDMETNKFLAGQIGGMLSVIVTQQNELDDIRLHPYYISGDGRESLCKYIIRKSMSIKGERCSNCIYWVHRKYYVPGTYEFRKESLPMTPFGKIDFMVLERENIKQYEKNNHLALKKVRIKQV